MIQALLDRLVAPQTSPLTFTQRNRYGHVASVTGLLTNILLATIKGAIGFLTGSIAVIGDALNNLTDTASSFITLLSFRLSARPADRRHPFGHARSEYLFSSLIAAAVIFVGFQLMIESVKKILSPVIVTLPPFAVILLVLSMLSKLFLWRFYHAIADRADSPIIRANAADSIADVLTTGVIVISILLSPIIGFDLDGFMGLAAGAIILKNGIEILRETIDKLLGQEPDSKLVEKVGNYVKAYEGVHGIHDLIIHDYGPGKTFASLHVEVDETVPALISHNLIDRIEADAARDIDIHLTLHMDPLNLHDPRTKELYIYVKSIVKDIDKRIDLHDFRIVDSYYTTNLVFDLALPDDIQYREKEIADRINHQLAEVDPRYCPKITFDPIYMVNH